MDQRVETQEMGNPISCLLQNFRLKKKGCEFELGQWEWRLRGEEGYNGC